MKGIIGNVREVNVGRAYKWTLKKLNVLYANELGPISEAHLGNTVQFYM